MIVQHRDPQFGSLADCGLASIGPSVVGNNMAALTMPVDLDMAMGKEQAP